MIDATQLCGFKGKMLWVDLAAQTAHDFDIAPYLEQGCLGARSIATRIAWEHMDPHTKPFDEGNLLIFIAGPLAGTANLGSSRGYLFGMSPQALPEQFERSSMGGRWASTMKYAGYDGVIFANKSAAPVIVEVTEGGAIFHPARSYWGRLTHDTQRLLKEELGRDVDSFAIGPAGENRVRIAAVTADFQNTSGQGGFGAVMGDKMLKAVSFRPSQGVTTAHPERTLSLRDEFFALHNRKPRTAPAEPEGQYWNAAADDESAFMLKDDMVANGTVTGITNRINGCRACGTECVADCYIFENARFVTTDKLSNSNHQCVDFLYWGWYPGTKIEQEWVGKIGREYRWPLNANRGLECTYLSNNYALNTWDITQMFLFLTRLEEEGVDVSAELGEEWNVDDPTLFPRLIKEMAHDEGAGKILGQGMARVSQTLCGGAYANKSAHLLNGYCSHGTGVDAYWSQPYPDWVYGVLSYSADYRDPFSDSAHTGLTFANYLYFSSPNYAGRNDELGEEFAYGAPHASGPDPALRTVNGGDMDEDEFDDMAYAGKEHMVRKLQIRGVIEGDMSFCDHFCNTVIDYRGTEKGSKGDWAMEAKMYNAVVGTEYTIDEMEKLAEPTLHIARCYSILEYGRDKAFDMQVCDTEIGVEGDWTTGKKLDRRRYADLLGRFYTVMGWDENGIPTEETLLRFGLEDCNEKMKPFRK